MSRLPQFFVAALVSPAVLAGVAVTLSSAPQDRQPASQPATRPSTQPEGADAALDRLLEPAVSGEPATTNRALAPTPGGQPNNATGRGAAAVAPDTPRQPLVPEGTYVIDRLVRVRRSVDQRGLEAVFVVDGQSTAAALDPPMLLAPNLNLMSVEAAVREDPDRSYRVTGRVTEYRGRNYLLLEKVVVR